MSARVAATWEEWACRPARPDCSATRLVASFPDRIEGAFADATTVFVLTTDEMGTVSLWSVPKSGDDPILSWSGEGLTFVRSPIAADDTDVYFSIVGVQAGAYASLLRLPRVGGDAEVLAEHQPGLTAIAVDETHVYWANLGVGGHAMDEQRLGRVMRREK